MSSFSTTKEQKDKLGYLVKRGLIRELFQRNQITQNQFERLMQLRRA